MSGSNTSRFICATHGHCFDGLASAVVLRELVEKTHPGAKYEVMGCGYGARQEKPTAELFQNTPAAIVDFRYAPLDSLAFYFDHHPTAFASTEDEAHFQKLRAGASSRFVFDASYSSCTKLIAHVAEREHGLELSSYNDLVAWADRIDSADFDSAKAATDTDDPVMRLVVVVEQFGDSAFLQQAADVIQRDGLISLATSDFVEQKFLALAPKRQEFYDRVEDGGYEIGRVAFVDLTERPTNSVTKFVQYRLWPECTYSVMVALMASGVRISVGHNPWSGKKLDTNISEICARYGGGGHPMVGGIGLPKEELESARKIAREIADELSRPA